LVVVDRTASTNDDARGLAAEGAPDGTVVVAASQTAGRGRLGRTWYSPAGAGLYLSAFFRPDEPLERCGRYALAAAVAACAACRDSIGPAAVIKWPNDVLAGGRKVGGILAEMRTGREGLELTVGIGMNLNHAAADFPKELRETATSLRILGGGEAVVLETFAARLLTHLGAEVADLRTNGWERVARRFLGYAPQAQGARVRLAAGGMGVTQGLDTTGALRVATEGGVVLVHAGESIAVLEG
jgi:BirA family biotin operon repressor/biotin-[acetyl-CoA-carboxylase] ligase